MNFIAPKLSSSANADRSNPGRKWIPGIKPLYLWYFTHVLPRIGRAISGHAAAYSYLPASVGTFASPAEFMQTLRAAGFSDVRADPLTFGIVYLYTALRK